MKKYYIKPAQRCIEIGSTGELLYGSINANGEGGATVNMNGNNDPVENTEFDSRTNGVWDNEW